MTSNEFVTRLAERYECKNKVHIEDLKNWLDTKNFNDNNLDKIYKKIIEDYEGFKMPSVAYINQLQYEPNYPEFTKADKRI